MNVKNTQVKPGAQRTWSRSIFVTTARFALGFLGYTNLSSVVYQTWPAVTNVDSVSEYYKKLLLWFLKTFSSASSLSNFQKAALCK